MKWLKITNRTAFLILFIVGIIVYANAFFNGLVGDDSEIYNLQIIPLFPHSFITFFQSQVDLTHSHTFLGQYYRPFPFFYFSIIKSIFGITPLFFRFPMITLQVCNGYLIFLLLSRFFAKKISLLSSLIFLVHLMNQEATVYIAVAQDVLYFFFGISGLLLFTQKPAGYRKKLLAALLFTLSLMSKETGALFIFVTLFYSYLFISKRIKERLINLAFVSGAVIVYVFMRISASTQHATYIAQSLMQSIPLSIRVISMPKIGWYYISSFFLPHATYLAPEWIIKSPNIQDFYLPLILDIVFVCIVVFIYIVLVKAKNHFKNLFLFFAVWYFMGILFHIQIFPLDQTVAERWFSFSFIGMLGMIGVVGEKYKTFIKRHEAVLLALFTVVFLTLGIQTMIRNADYADAFTLYSHDIQFTGGNFILENNLGSELFARNSDQALAHFKKAIQFNPNWWTAWDNIGIYYEKKKDYTQAEKYYLYVVNKGNLIDASENLGRVYLLAHDYKKALSFTNSTLKENPDDPKILIERGIARYELGDKNSALLDIQRSFQIFPADSTKQIYQVMTNNGILQ